MAIPEMTPQEVNSQLSKLRLIDVRRPEEFTGELGHIKGAQLVTLETDFEASLGSLSKDAVYVFVCRSGMRSGKATAMAQAAGLNQVFNMSGGMIAWNEAGLPVEK